MKNTKTSLFATVACAATMAFTLTACGSGSNNEVEPTPTPSATATPAPTPTPSPSPTPTPAPARVSKMPAIYYFDETGQWRLMPGVTPAQAINAGALCKIPVSEGTRNAYLAAGRTSEWIAANLYDVDLCPGY
jgi:hypothetical protein